LIRILDENGEGTWLASTTLQLSSGQHTLEIEDAMGCRYLSVVDIYEAAPFRVSLPDEIIAEQGDFIELKAEATAQVGDWNWSADFSFTAIANAVEFTAFESGFITITATDVFGCTASANTRLVVESSDYYASNAFSPNGDGINDRFEIFLADGWQLVEFQIYDRWGSLVHDSLLPWQPKSRFPQGVYVWRGVIVSSQGERVEIGGDVVLVD